MIIVGVTIWLILSFYISKAGSKREIGGFWSFLVFLLFSPIIGFVIVVLSDKKKSSGNQLKERTHQEGVQNAKDTIYGFVILIFIGLIICLASNYF